MKSLAQKTTSFFLEHGIIDPNQTEWCTYALELRFERTFAFCIFSLLGILLHKFIETMIFLFVLSFIRSKTNGYHVSSFIGCFIRSLICILIGVIGGSYLPLQIGRASCRERV